MSLYVYDSRSGSGRIILRSSILALYLLTIIITKLYCEVTITSARGQFQGRNPESSAQLTFKRRIKRTTEQTPCNYV